VPATNGVLDLARVKWESSGLTDEHAKALKLLPLSAEQTGALGFHKGPSLQIPYFDFVGQPTDFFRLRYLGTPPGWAGVVEKPMRYVQPKGTLNEVYLPPLLDRTWEDLADDTNVAIIITEGEFKAACAAVHGLPCLGLGGVDVWRATKRGIELLPALEKIAWQGRKVIIAYDSDAATNVNVVRAQRQLAKVLMERGALPAIASLPATADGAKQGLDDFLVAEGPEALAELLQNAPAFPESAALWGLNEEVVYVRDPGIIIVRETGQKLNPKHFTGHAYANRHYLETIITKDGVKSKTKPLAPRWVEWERRFEVQRVTYRPGRGELVDVAGSAWEWNVWPGWGVAPKRGDIEPWTWLLDFLFKDEIKARRWFEQWCAYPLLNPGTKLYTGAVIWGLAKGTGKTALAYALMRIYGRNAIEIKNKDLKGGFNSWAENRQLVYADEITGGDRRVDADYLKGLITQESVRVNAKFLPEYTLPDCINYIFTSNHPDAIFIEDYERRFFVHEVEGGPAERAKYERLDAWLKGDGPSALFWHLLHLNVSGFNPREHAPVTKAARAMSLAGKSDIGMWCLQLREDPKSILKLLGDKPAAECELFTAGQLLRAYDPEGRSKVTTPGMSRELRRAGFIQVNDHLPVRTNVGLQRLWAVRGEWGNKSPKDMSEHFNGFFGDQRGAKY
jgi:hypothetical protein